MDIQKARAVADVITEDARLLPSNTKPAKEHHYIGAIHHLLVETPEDAFCALCIVLDRDPAYGGALISTINGLAFWSPTNCAELLVDFEPWCDGKPVITTIPDLRARAAALRRHMFAIDNDPEKKALILEAVRR